MIVSSLGSVADVISAFLLQLENCKSGGELNIKKLLRCHKIVKLAVEKFEFNYVWENILFCIALTLS